MDNETKKNGLRNLHVTKELLRSVMRLPETTEIRSINYDVQTDTLVFTIKDDSFSHVGSGMVIPKIDAEYELKQPFYEFKGWR